MLKYYKIIKKDFGLSGESVKVYLDSCLMDKSIYNLYYENNLFNKYLIKMSVWLFKVLNK